MKYHIFLNNYDRVTIDDEHEDTEGQCVSLKDGEIITEENADELFNDDSPSHEESLKERWERYLYFPPEERKYLYECWRAHALAGPDTDLGDLLRQIEAKGLAAPDLELRRYYDHLRAYFAQCGQEPDRPTPPSLRVRH